MEMLLLKKQYRMGATAVIIDDVSYAMPNKTILVDDVLQTLQQLAKHHREQFSIPFIAITGSNGKTSTKSLYILYYQPIILRIPPKEI